MKVEMAQKTTYYLGGKVSYWRAELKVVEDQSPSRADITLTNYGVEALILHGIMHPAELVEVMKQVHDLWQVMTAEEEE